MLDPIVAAGAFYLVGAIVGLFNRLYSESGEGAAIEDYGLSWARLLLTPVLSGLAAVGGVLITAMLIGVVNGSILMPRPGPPGAEPAQPPPAAASQPAEPARPDAIFSLDRYPFGLVVAAVFGLTPGLLIRRLKSEGEIYKDDLQRSEAKARLGTPKGAPAAGPTG
jgi:hypothetical protein